MIRDRSFETPTSMSCHHLFVSSSSDPGWYGRDTNPLILSVLGDCVLRLLPGVLPGCRIWARRLDGVGCNHTLTLPSELGASLLFPFHNPQAPVVRGDTVCGEKIGGGYYIIYMKFLDTA